MANEILPCVEAIKRAGTERVGRGVVSHCPPPPFRRSSVIASWNLANWSKFDFEASLKTVFRRKKPEILKFFFDLRHVTHGGKEEKKKTEGSGLAQW